MHVTMDRYEVNRAPVGMCADLWLLHVSCELLLVSDCGAVLVVDVTGVRPCCEQADWRIVERGWHAHVLGEAPHTFTSAVEGVKTLRVSAPVFASSSACARRQIRHPNVITTRCKDAKHGAEMVNVKGPSCRVSCTFHRRGMGNQSAISGCRHL
jgi:hypothetical protein